jgi:hypothetical protein
MGATPNRIIGARKIFSSLRAKRGNPVSLFELDRRVSWIKSAVLAMAAH